jgi:Uncharacterized protein conserved in bacteria (DUF2188)
MAARGSRATSKTRSILVTQIAKEKNQKALYVEEHDGRYSVKRGGAERAIAITDTQKEAINIAKGVDPPGGIHVELVRDVGPGPDKWRKV